MVIKSLIEDSIQFGITVVTILTGVAVLLGGLSLTPCVVIKSWDDGSIQYGLQVTVVGRLIGKMTKSSATQSYLALPTTLPDSIHLH